MDWESRGGSIDYFTDEIRTYDENATWGGFVETRALGGLKTRPSVLDANPERGRCLRTFFDLDRSGAVIGTDERLTRRGTTVTLRASGTF